MATFGVRLGLLALAAGSLAVRAQQPARSDAQALPAACLASSETGALGACVDALESAGRWREAVPYLERLVQRSPDNIRRRFQLGRFLSWLPARREEALALLRQAAAARPEATEYRLAVAEVMSWDARRRSEAVAEYQAILRAHPDNATARARLAEVWSWQGQLRRAERAYDALLAEQPAFVPALVGRAEVLAWSGRNLAAVATLEHVPREDRDNRWRLARATASFGLGRYDAARATLTELLAQEPDNPYARDLLDRVEDWRATQVTVGFGLMRGSGEPTTSQLNFDRSFAQVSFAASSWSRLEVAYQPTRFFNRASGAREHHLSVGWQGQPRDRLGVALRLDAARYPAGPGDFTGAAELTWRRGDVLALQVGFTRDVLLDSVAAAAGVVASGQLIGRARANLVHVAFNLRLPASGIELFVRPSAGAVTGLNLDTNRRAALDAGVGRTWRVADRHYLRAGYGFSFLSHAEDFGAFPSPLPTRSTGGYFSPTRFFNNAAQVALNGRIRRWSYSLGGSLGVQQSDTTFNDLDDARLSSTAETTHTLRLTRRWHLLGSYAFLNVGGAFRRHQASLALRYYPAR